jgi:7-carboxy-7-deazaguanine synthase
MRNLRLTELYSSVQGEGPRTGEVTTFVRFGGCNLRCPGWPCDTQHAIDPAIWSKDPLVPPEQLLSDVLKMSGNNVCITGGEPTMQDPAALQILGQGLLEHGRTVDVFTNGTMCMLPPWMGLETVCVMLDWKLQGSGDSQKGAEIRLVNAKHLSPKDGLKFVIASPCGVL